MKSPVESDAANLKFQIDETALEIVQEYAQSPNFIDFESPKTLKLQYKPDLSALYRYDGKAVIVYDSHARSCSDFKPDPSSFQEKAMSSSVKRDLEKANPFDRAMYLTLPKLCRIKHVANEYTLVVPPVGVLKFESRFESGNLHSAARVSEDEYNLTLEYDFHTRGHTQWYYFSVKPYKAPHAVRFNICNLVKFDSLYNDGLKPCVYSLKKQELTGTAWHRAGRSLSYFKNAELRKGSTQPNYTLTFVYEFLYPDDTVYFAHCFPYTYTDLEVYLSEIESSNSQICRVDTLCKTLGGNDCKVITITQGVRTYQSWGEEQEKMKKSAGGRKLMRIKELRQEAQSRIIEQVRNREQTESEHAKKKGVFLTARVHPGESNASFMMQGALDFLLSDSKEAKLLRKLYVFKIIPMMNPDGVIYGNYRCSLLGVDLNRRWLQPSKYLHPTVYHAKRLLMAFSEDRELLMSLDMHGHSMKRNAFIYGCASRSQDIDEKRKSLLVRVIPYLIAERNKLFSFSDCKFRLEKAKESTQRCVVYKSFDVLNSFTVEASFYGPKDPAALGRRGSEDEEGRASCHFDEGHLKSLGRDICRVLATLNNPAAMRKKIAELCIAINAAQGCTTTASAGVESKREISTSSRQSVAEQAVEPNSIQAAEADHALIEDDYDVASEAPDSPELTGEMLDFNDLLGSVEPQMFEGIDLCDEDSEGSDKCPSDNDEKKREISKTPKIKKRTLKKKKPSKAPLPNREEKQKKPEQEKLRKALPKLTSETPKPSTSVRYPEQTDNGKDIKRQIEKIYDLLKHWNEEDLAHKRNVSSTSFSTETQRPLYEMQMHSIKFQSSKRRYYRPLSPSTSFVITSLSNERNPAGNLRNYEEQGKTKRQLSSEPRQKFHLMNMRQFSVNYPWP
mmetsp:Transcript_9856/g.19518  ORF Transcript_9856/g.19518 Transcript_9856/m.19518 type:complete len:901 (+) Transcript_9856:277-2979(+)